MDSLPGICDIASVSMSYTSQRIICHNLWQNWSGSRGVSNYELSQALPNELKSDLPSIKELGAQLDGAESSEGGEAGEGSRERED